MDGTDNRGVIRNRKYSNQVKDFSGIRYGNMTPTDIDMFLDYHGKCFVFGEFKYLNTELPFGQRLALERVCDSAKLPSIAVIASHDCQSDEDINCANSIVSEYRWEGKWIPDRKEETIKQLIDRFIHWIEGGAQ